MRENPEILREIGGADIVRFIKAQRIRWLGHIMRKEGSTIKLITQWKPGEDRPRGRPRIRWHDEVTKDLRKMGVAEWTEKAKDRKAWRKIVNEAKTHGSM